MQFWDAEDTLDTGIDTAQKIIAETAPLFFLRVLAESVALSDRSARSNGMKAGKQEKPKDAMA